MELHKFHVLLAMVFVLFLVPVVHGWGLDGHYSVCKIAQSRLSKAAAKAVEELLPHSANGDLASVCIWADRVKFRYHWSSPLHYIDTPDKLCTYRYSRDCKDEDGVADRCVAGAINNYTNQLLTYNKGSGQASTYNLTEALLFLSHFIGDIHQPLHVGFTSDRGGNTIDVHWYRRKAVLHHVWDTNIIETAEERYDDSNVDELVDALQKNITTGWADQVDSWESCSGNMTACPDIYASEGIKAACDWAYKGVTEDSTLEDDYFLTRYPIVQWRLAQGGVRLAATLNRIFE
ncbi:Endonuclease 5 [Capsicum annuum]|uniref:Aspergillus nuclease S1 n=1 Tax=Capsicum annuum TaxID=4072 RepID=A0A2G2YC67_CAPAN|nr:endonuclease 2 [Capsicum annuum]PHT67343.1 Endonuclease 5 [Capsicum annuum]